MRGVVVQHGLRGKYLPLVLFAVVLLLFVWARFSQPQKILLNFINNMSVHQNEVFAISAYLEPDNASVRIFFMKKPEVTVRLKCYIQSCSKKVESGSLSNSNIYGDGGLQYAELTEFGGKYRGYVTFCQIPHHLINSVIPYCSTVSIQEEGRDSKADLPISLGRLNKQTNQTEFKHRLAMCMTPIFNTASFTPRFLVEYIELQRQLGITLINFYLTEEPSLAIRNVIQSYLRHPRLLPGSDIEVRVIQWILPVPNPATATWYHDQVLSFNDCLYRVAKDAEYIFFGDLDEIFVPAQNFVGETKVLPTWSEVLSAVTKTHGSSHPTLCFPGKFFPPNDANVSSEESIFDRHLATVEAFPERRKCLIRTRDVEEVYVHSPVKPSMMLLASNLGVIFHYRTCLRKAYNPCGPNTRYALNTELKPYREAIEHVIAIRLQNM